jgi:hypothetical protein
MRKRNIVFTLTFIAAIAFSQQPASERFEKVMNRMVQAINAADYVGIQRDFGKVMLDALPLEKSTPVFMNLSAQYGKIQKLDYPRLTPPGQAIFSTHFERGILDIKIVLDNQDKIIGLWFLPHTPGTPVPDKHETEVSFPSKGRWLVVWGGDTEELNQHHSVPNQRFAFDLVAVNEEGKSHKGDGIANDDYYAFGKEIFAPADGIVTDVIDGVRDNVPGSMNPYSALGNAVVIQHREHEVSVLAHLKLGTAKVRVGENVKRGQVIGLCGNSGNSSEPHLHYHLQNTPIIQDGTGIKCYFRKLTLMKNGNTETKVNYSPTKWEIVWQE